MADVIRLQDLAFFTIYRTIIDYLNEIPAFRKRKQVFTDHPPSSDFQPQEDAFHKVRALYFTITLVLTLLSFIMIIRML